MIVKKQYSLHLFLRLKCFLFVYCGEFINFYLRKNKYNWTFLPKTMQVLINKNIEFNMDIVISSQQKTQY
jgi:hypothetical protein